ncbi:MAG: HAD hydrolase-like protein [Methylobacter sp.]|uniref:HAD family hydrolase n=1 Tax=Methylobacter sp. TaxID=2051955 RepID=UPI0025CBCF7E|nr:HAD hydrolase-like protein [Methylobacter sp.]MCK9619208.1 HAD hydrolase-like protein [Methylobacter sp.]
MATMIKNATNKTSVITCLFVDIGGVLLSNGWDHHLRKQAATDFKLDWDELESRHHLNVDVYETDKLTLKDYLARVVFYEERPFTPTQFRDFMFAHSQPYPEMIELVTQLKIRYGLKIFVVSNEAREINDYRIEKFKLDEFVDCFISSCYVHLRKPDKDIFRLALDIAQVPAKQTAYIENTPLLVQVAETFGIRGILHTDYKSTCEKLAALGLINDEEIIP